MILNNKAVGELPTDYPSYFGASIDTEALRYLTLANDMLHDLYPFIVTIAEGTFSPLRFVTRQTLVDSLRCAVLLKKVVSASTIASEWVYPIFGRSKCSSRFPYRDVDSSFVRMKTGRWAKLPSSLPIVVGKRRMLPTLSVTIKRSLGTNPLPSGSWMPKCMAT